MSETLFEVWVEGRPLLDEGGQEQVAPLQQVLRFPEEEARRLVARIEAEGRRAVLVPDQSKRPPDEEMLQDR